MYVIKVVVREGTSKKAIKDKVKFYFPDKELAELFVIRYNDRHMEQFPSWYHYAEVIGEVHIHNPFQFLQYSYKGELVEMPEDWEYVYEIPH